MLESTIPMVNAQEQAAAEPGHRINTFFYGTGSTQNSLVGLILDYARSIDDLGVLGDAVEQNSAKVPTQNIPPEHWPFVAGALLGAISGVTADGMTDDIIAAWSEAYSSLAELLTAPR